MSNTPNTLYDVIIIGGGPAGLSAALTLGRALRQTLLFDDNRPRNAAASHSHGFLTRDGVPPVELRRLGRGDVGQYPSIEMRNETVLSVSSLPPSPTIPLSFNVTTETAAYTARRVIFASGLKDTVPDIEGLSARWGRDVFHCPYCHGYEFKGETLGLYCPPSLASHMGPLITQWSSSVTLFHGEEEGALSDETKEMMAAMGVKVVSGDVEELVVESDKIVGFRMKGGALHRFTALLTSTLPLIPNDSILRSLSCEVTSTPFGMWVNINRFGETSQSGVFACGNVIDGMQTIAMAVSSGVMAGVGANTSLTNESVKVKVEMYRSLQH